MRGYVTKRLLIAVVTLFGMSIVIFSLMRLAPGNIVDILFESAGYVDQADKKQLERELGVDRPLAVQYARCRRGRSSSRGCPSRSSSRSSRCSSRSCSASRSAC